MIKKYKLLFISLALCLGTGALGSFFTISSIPTWYATLNKPFFTPPNFVFGPVWTTLYVLMAIALYLVLSKKTKDKLPLYYFLIQLLLNFLWSVIFFYLHLPVIAYLEIVLLWIFTALTIKSFYKYSRKASYLMVPYILWITFASFLNLGVVLLNH